MCTYIVIYIIIIPFLYRGIGGIFFDDLNEGGSDHVFDLVSSCANAFLPAYSVILNRRKDTEYNEDMKRWQQLRRGRYVEFNLIHDRGTKFGLSAPGIYIIHYIYIC